MKSSTNRALVAKKQSTSFAQMANNLLNVLQGCSKSIRLLLAMFLTLTVSATAWGADFEKYSGTITEGDYLIVYSNGAMKNTVSSDRLQYTNVTVSNNKISNPDASLIWHIAPSGSYWTIYNANVSKYAAGTGVKNKAQLLASGTDDKSLWTVSGTSTYEFVNKANKAAGVNSNLRKNSTYGFACYGTSTGGALTLYKKVTAAPSFTITAYSNNTTYGTVSLDGTTITASPNTGYRVSTTTPYTISPLGSATVTPNGNTFTVTPSANTTITINFEAIPTHQIIFNTGGLNVIAPISVAEGSTCNITQEPTGLTNECEYNTFVGWTTENSISNPSTKPEIVTSVEMGNTDINLYAVYSKTEGGGGSGNYEKVTTASELEDGQYLIVYESGSVAFNGDLTTLDAVSNTISVTITNNTIVPTSTIDAAVFTYDKTNNTLKSASGYYIGKTAYGNGLDVSTTAYTNTITFDNSGNCVITASGGCTLRYNNANDQNRFRYYKSGQQAIQLYKKGNAGTTTYSLTPQCTTQTTDCSLLEFTTDITGNYTATYTQNAPATALTVAAKYDNGSTGVTYQWYSNATNSITNGTLINDAISASYTPLTTTTGTTYYYCVATYDEECTITSKVATVTITAPVTTFTVTFDSDGGSAVANQTIEEGETATTPSPAPTKTGYTFVGWYNGDTEFDFDTPITDNITLKAKWQICLYTLTWDLNGGTVTTAGTHAAEGATGSLSGDVEYGASITAPIVEREGYRFDGWKKGNAIVTPATTMPANNLTYTAQWAKLHTITWKVGGNEYTTGSPTTSVESNQKISSIPDAPDDNTLADCGATKFMGWTTDNIGSTPDADAPTDLFTTVAEAQSKIGNITENKTFYAVFATAEGDGSAEGWTLTSNGLADLTSSDVFVFAVSAEGTYYAMPNDEGTSSSPTLTAITVEDSKITSEVLDKLKWNISGDATNGYIFYPDGSTTTWMYCNTTKASSSNDNIRVGTGSRKAWKQNSSTKYLYNDDNTTRYLSRNGTSDFRSYVDTNNYPIVPKVFRYNAGTTYSNYVTNCCNTPAPTNGAYTSVSGTEIQLTWNDAANTNYYHITGGNLSAGGVYSTNKYKNITGLTECEEYTFYVSAHPAEGCESAAIQISAQPFGDAKTVNYDYNGGSGSPESFTTSCDDDKREIILPVATRTGYTFEGWYDSEENKVGDAGATYDPATSPITLKAKWTETNYTLTHNGSNYTITENKTSIKSSETPFTLHYTCTGDYGLPATISITGGGKSWTEVTDYTWEVAADRQSAILVIKETVISANVTITINVATRYTVTFIHNDKGVFTGSETLEVLSSENTITLPTVTDVSCGFYDTFEGWIVANEDYTESTSKPAGTIYKGGANYTVNDDCTLRALYSKCEGDATQVYRKVTTTGEVTDGTYILVANTAEPRVYSGYGGATYGSSVDGLTADGEDFSTTLPTSAKPITVTTGTGTNAGTFAMYNEDRNKYLTYTGSSNTLDESDSKVFIWKLTDGLDVNSRPCPAGVLTPNGFDTRVLQCNTSSSNRFACYTNNASFPHVFLYKLIDKCTKYYSTNPSCEKPVGVHIVYNANAVDASMSCSTQNRTYKVEDEENQYPQLASQLQFCTNATREGYTLVGWNTQENGQGTTYNINQNYYNLPVSGELDGDKWITLNLYAMWKPCIKFNLGNATGGTGVPDAVVENGGCVLPTPTAEQLGTIPCGYEFYAWSETSVNATQTKPALFMPGDTYTGSALTLYAVYRWCEGNAGSDTYYFTFVVNDKTYCITQKHNSYDRFVVEEATSGLIFGLENGYLYYLDEGEKTFVYWEGDGTTVTTTATYPNADTQKTTFVDAGDGTTIVTPAISGRYLQMSSTDRAYYTTGGTNPTLVEVQSSICTYATNPTCYTNTNLHFVTHGGTLNYPTDYNETNYQELAIGDDILLPTATFAGEWTFEGWKRGAPLESTTTKPYDPSFYSVTLNTTQFEVDALGDIYFYAVYSKTNDDKQFDPVNGGTYKLFAIGADDTKTYMPIWNGGRGTMSGVTECNLTGDYTITPGTGTHAGQYQITCGEHTLGVVGDIDQTDLKEVEGTWWNISESTSNKGTWRITVVGSSERALSCSFSTAKSFGNYAISNLNNPAQTIYRDMEIGECIYTEYTSTPENIPYITITGAPVKITSTNGERVYASTTVHIEAHNFTGKRIIHLSATNGFGVDPEEVQTNEQGAYSGNVKVYYEPTTDGDGQAITTSVLTASQTGGTNAEKISQTFAAIQGRNMPANFVIAAKWDGLWYALPANCTSSLSSTEGLLIEVNDMENPTMATSAPASAKYGIREVIPSRQTDYGQGIVFTERFAKDDKQFALYNGSDANIQVNAQYSNYAATNPDKYEWIPTTSDFNEYTVTNASTGRNLGLTSGSYGAYTAANNRVYLLPATFYEPAPVQVLKWKANSVIVMYTGAETTATTQVGNNDKSAEQALANQQLTHGIYELTTNQALTSNAGGVLKLNFGASTRVELEIPLIISGEVTASANAHDVVILENSKLTAAETKYSYKDVYVYGGGKLAIPDGTALGVNNIILRAGGVATDGAGQNATYQYIYPQVELKGTLTSSVQNIRYEYVTDYDHWYHLALSFDGSLASIHYPYEYYGDQVKLDNKGSWIIKRYDGATRATGNYDAWKDIEEDEPKATTVTAGKGYIYWGAPKKITANDVYDRPTWGIQRITMSVSAPDAKDAENGNKTIAGLSSYANVPNNSEKDNDQGWNLIGNPYMVNLKDMATTGLHACKLVEVIDPATGKWNGKWEWNNEINIRYLTIPSEHFDTYGAKTVSEAISANALVPGRAFFVQLEGAADGITFATANRASLMPALLAENSDKPVDIETGIILSNETLQDEVNFWIKDGKTNNYEYNADYPKTPNNNHFNIYGVHTNGDLSWVATSPEYAAQSMPIGYQVPAAGTFTLSVSETYYSENLQALFVTDHEASPEVTTNLVDEDYTFYVNQAETNNTRFTVSIILKPDTENTPTGVDNINTKANQPIKFLYQDKIYILRNGMIYDTTGKQVITINK